MSENLFVTNLTLERYNKLLEKETNWDNKVEELELGYKRKEEFLQPKINISLRSNSWDIYVDRTFQLKEGLLSEKQFTEIKDIFTITHNSLNNLIDKAFPDFKDKIKNGVKKEATLNCWNKIINFISNKYK